MKKNQNFSMASGDDLVLSITVKTESTCVAVDLTDATATWVLSRAPGCTPLVTVAGVLTSPTTGVLTVTLVPADTDDLCSGRYYHELQLTDALDKVSTVMTGTARIMKDSVT